MSTRRCTVRFDFAFVEHSFFDKIAILTKLSATI